MESTNELVTAAEARVEGLSLDGVANNRCITKQQFNDNLPGGGISEDDLDLLANTIGNNLAVLVVNNTNTTISCTVVVNNRATAQNETTTFNNDPHSIKVLKYTETYVNITLNANHKATANAFASIYNAAGSSYVQLKKSNVTDTRFQVGNPNFLLQGGVMLVSFNGV